MWAGRSLGMGLKLEPQEIALQSLAIVTILCAGYLLAGIVGTAQIAFQSLSWLPVDVITPLIKDFSLVIAIVLVLNPLD